MFHNIHPFSCCLLNIAFSYSGIQLYQIVYIQSMVNFKCKFALVGTIAYRVCNIPGRVGVGWCDMEN